MTKIPKTCYKNFIYSIFQTKILKDTLKLIFGNVIRCSRLRLKFTPMFFYWMFLINVI